MALKATLTKDEHGALAEGLRAAYRAEGDGFVLDLEKPEGDKGKDPKDAKVDEFRDRNIALLKEKAELEAKLKALDEQRAKADEERKKADDAKLSDSERLNKRIEELTATVKTSQEQAATERAALATERMHAAIRAQATKEGVRAKAIDDVIGRAVAAGFTADEKGAPKPPEGVTLDDFFGNLRKDADFLYEPTKGDGGGTGTAGTKTPEGVIQVDFAKSQDAEWRRAHAKDLAEGKVQVMDG